MEKKNAIQSFFTNDRIMLFLVLVNSIFVDAMAGDNKEQVMKKLEDLEKKLDQTNRKETPEH